MISIRLTKLIDIDAPHQSIDVDAPDERVYLDTADKLIDIDALHQSVDVDPLNERVDIDALHQVIFYLDPSHESVDVDPLHERVDIDALHQVIYLDPSHESVDVDSANEVIYLDAADKLIDIDLLHERVDVEPVDDGRHDRLEHVLRAGLGGRPCLTPYLAAAIDERARGGYPVTGPPRPRRGVPMRVARRRRSHFGLLRPPAAPDAFACEATPTVMSVATSNALVTPECV